MHVEKRLENLVGGDKQMIDLDKKIIELTVVEMLEILEQMTNIGGHFGNRLTEHQKQKAKEQNK